jgi:hypothetical protein
MPSTAGIGREGRGLRRPAGRAAQLRVVCELLAGDADRRGCDPSGQYRLGDPTDPDNGDAYRIEFENATRVIASGAAPAVGRATPSTRPPRSRPSAPPPPNLEVAVVTGPVDRR